MAGADEQISAQYRTDINVHAPMEPMNATVEIKDGVYHIHCGDDKDAGGDQGRHD